MAAPNDPTLDLPALADPTTAVVHIGPDSTESIDRTRTSDDAVPQAAPRFGTVTVAGYELLGELGRGGMGVVYRARQAKLNRPVALKMVLGTHAADKKELIRFLAEAEAVAAVKHPNVVQVYEYGQHENRPYMALEFVPGGTLAARLKRSETPLTATAAAELVERIARGVAAAHDLGIVHRDLKPGNILLAADGSPKVADFGLAKSAGKGDLTQTGAIMGTPHYMAPEQASGMAKFVGPQADVYALGVILYECLTHTVPFDGEDTWAVIRKVVGEMPESPRRRVKAVTRDLEVICLKCLSKAPGDRYATAGELADDLRRHLDGKPVAARPLGAVSRGVRWCRRNPSVAGLLAAVFAVLAAGVVVSALFAADALAEAKQKDTALGAKAKALTDLEIESKAREAADGEKNWQMALAVRESQTALYGRDIRDAFDALAASDYGRLRQSLAAAAPDLRGWEWRHLNAVAGAKSRALPTAGHEGSLNKLIPSPNGRHLIGFGGHPTEWVVVWDTAGGKPVTIPDRPAALGQFQQPDRLEHALFFADSKRVLIVRRTSYRVWDVTAPTKPLAEGKLAGDPQSCYAAALSGDGKRFAVVTNDPAPLMPAEPILTARVYEIESGKVEETLPLAVSKFNGSCAIAPELDRVLFARPTPDGKAVDLCSASFREPKPKVLANLTGSLLALHMAADGKQLVLSRTVPPAGPTDAGIRVEWWADETGANRRTLPHGPGGLLSVCHFAAGEKGVLLGVTAEKALSFEVVHWMPATTGSVRTSPLDIRTIPSGFGDDKAYVLGTQGAPLILDLADDGGTTWLVDEKVATPMGFAIADDLTVIAVDGQDGIVQSFDVRGGRKPTNLFAPGPGQFGLRELAGSRDGRRMAGVVLGDPTVKTDPPVDGTVLVFDAPGGRQVSRFPTAFGPVVGTVSLSPDGDRVAVGPGADTIPGVKRADLGVKLHFTAKGKWIRTLPTGGRVVGVAFSPDGKRIAAAVYTDRHAIADPPPKPGATDRIGFVIAWNADTGEEAWRVELKEELKGLAFNADGTRLAVPGTGELSFLTTAPTRVTLLRADTGATEKVLRLPSVSVGPQLLGAVGGTTPAFTPDGTRLAVPGEDAVTVWDTATYQQVATIPNGAWKVAFAPDGKRLIGLGVKGLWVRATE